MYSIWLAFTYPSSLILYELTVLKKDYGSM